MISLKRTRFDFFSKDQLEKHKVCCSGHGKNGALCVLQQSIRPELITEYCAMGLGLVGLDFRGLLPPLFEDKEIAEYLATRAQEVGRSTSARSSFADAALVSGYPTYKRQT